MSDTVRLPKIGLLSRTVGDVLNAIHPPVSGPFVFEPERNWNALEWLWLLPASTRLMQSESADREASMMAITPDNDWVIGTGGDDTLDGGAGADTMVGGAGNDTYYVDNMGDVVGENANQGQDTVHASVDYALSNNIEDLVLGGSAIYGTGNSLDNRIIGNGYDNRLDGGEGNDLLEGGEGDDVFDGSGWTSNGDPRSGNDTLIGGTGDDYYYVNYDAASGRWDVVIENADEGDYDAIYVLAYPGLTFTLVDNVEGLTVLGEGLTAIGNSLDNYLTAQRWMNTLDGGVGDDSLESDGGNILIGGTGDDVYYIALHSMSYYEPDLIIENADEGIDTVFSHVSVTTLAPNVENLTLAFNPQAAYGNELSNIIRIWARTTDQNVTIDGGAGADTMYGNLTNDTYYVDNAGDIVAEANRFTSIDSVFSTIDYALSNNVEHLQLEGAALVGTGNTLDNRITGNNNNNTLRGNEGNDTLDGGTGNDSMSGGAGNDTYFVNSSADRITELAGEGTDTINSSVNWTLGANTESLTLTGSAIRGVGNALNNTIQGNAAGNILNGGSGSDTLTGGAGADQFEFGASHTGSDTLVDFAQDEDQIVLSGFLLDPLEEGYNLMIDTGAAGEYGTLLYSTTTGSLSYDEDGTGAMAARQITVLSNRSNLTASDFFLI
jgi:Ca2+-binding RTX toxin-like protein